MDNPNQIPLATQHSLWLDDMTTQALIAYLEKQIKTKTAALFSTRRSSPSQLPDSVAELELASVLLDTVTKGKFLN